MKTDRPYPSPHGAIAMVFRNMRKEGDWEGVVWGAVFYPIFILIATGLWLYYRPTQPTRGLKDEK